MNWIKCLITRFRFRNIKIFNRHIRSVSDSKIALVFDFYTLNYFFTLEKYRIFIDKRSDATFIFDTKCHLLAKFGSDYTRKLILLLKKKEIIE